MLNGVSVEDFIEIERTRYLYEKQLDNGNRQSNDMIVATSYRASIQDDNMRIFISAGWIPIFSLREITEELLKSCKKGDVVEKSVGKIFISSITLLVAIICR